MSHLNFLTHRFPQFSPRNLCFLVMLVVSSLIFTATDTAFYVLISLGLAESIIFPGVPLDICPRTPLISFCTVQQWTFCSTHSLATLCLSTTSGPDPGELPGFWSSMVFCHAPIPQKGSGKQQQQQKSGYKKTEVRDYKGLQRVGVVHLIWPAHQPSFSLAEMSAHGPIVA